MPSELPPMYYLEHARELFGFVRTECRPLLTQTHLKYLDGISALNENAECLLVRCLARKPKFIKTSSLTYPEISDLSAAITELSNAGFLTTARASDWLELAPQLTKPQLIECLAHAPISIKASTSKATLLTHALDSVAGVEPHLDGLFSDFLARRKTEVFEYITFLFFGDIGNRFQQFAMRDLGVLKTRKNVKTITRFESLNAAMNAFKLQQKRRDFMLRPSELKVEMANYLLSQKAIGHSAQEIRDKLLLNVGNALVDDDFEKAIELWRHSKDPLAVEKWVRESYKRGSREKLAKELIKMRNNGQPPVTQVFIEDFYARKYQGKRTSVYTDMLREAARKIEIDEAYINDVETGVIEHYQRHGVEAYFAENTLWQMLFALTFWDLLFGEKQTQFSGFDRLPSQLRTNTFFSANTAEIDKSLKLLENPAQALQVFTKLVVQNYGKPTGIFRWSNTLLNKVQTLVNYSPPKSLAQVLRSMAKNYQHTRDGHPDLMVVEHGKLRFEEIKAPGDVLRPNQLLGIKRLRKAGLQVDVSQVEWSSNPEQIYAVVDIETTGARKGGNAITEIAVVKVRNLKIVGQWSTLVNPQRHIPTHITRLTGIDDAMVANAPVFAEISQELEAQLHNCIFVAHNVGFDYGFIKAAYEALGESFKKPKFCTVHNSRKTFPGLKSYSLSALAEHFDINLVGHHRALSDATATAHLLRLLQEHKLLYAKRN